VNRSYLDFFMGFGHSLSVAMLLQSVLLWQIATIARSGEVPVRPLIGAFVLATAASGFLAWRFIFPLPAAFSLLLTAVLALAFFVARS
jgi:hypothetical protein